MNFLKRINRVFFTSALSARFCLWIAATCLIGAGCVSKNVNPISAGTNTGYVDFYDTNDTEVSWEIDQVKPNGNFKKIFFEFDPIKESTLRLALQPGRYHFNVTIVNYAILGPGTADVEIRNGMVTPVRVALVDNGTGLVSKKEARLSSTAYGRYGRRTRFIGIPTQFFHVHTEPEEPLPYRPKSEMPYAEAGGW